MRLCFFVTPHGFGHAARAAAVMIAVQRRHPDCKISVVTTVPEWFFSDSGVTGFEYHSLRTDVGFVQSSPTEEDIGATVKLLRTLLPFREELLRDVTALPGVGRAHLIVSDIAPLGIAVAARAGVPSVLVENFTWDWIYEGHPDATPELHECAAELRTWFRRADYRITCAPACERVEGAQQVSPCSRAPRTDPIEMRRRLSIPESHKVVLVSMGGVQGRYDFTEKLAPFRNIATFLVASPGSEIVRRENVVHFPPRSSLYHPDLVAVADVVVGKAGYSTVAESYYAGVGFGVVSRARFRESTVMERFLEANLATLTIREEEFETGAWCRMIPEILTLERSSTPPKHSNGADEVARILPDLID